MFLGNPEDGEYDEHFQPIQSKVVEIVDTLPEDDMESLVEVILYWEYQAADVCLKLHERIYFNGLSRIVMASSLEYFEKYVNHLKT